MSHNSDKEVDILLRRHAARRNSSSLPGAKDAREGLAASTANAEHMDADELSAYAEGALPEAPRARYIAHLADCDSCRRIATELILASSAEAEESKSGAQSESVQKRSWREWLASLFSAPALRYAVPALALIAFVAIVIVITTRNRDETSLVARNDQPRQQTENLSATEPKNETATSSTVTNNSSENHGTPSTAASANNASANPVDVKPGSPSPQQEQQGQLRDANTSSVPSQPQNGVTFNNMPTVRPEEAPMKPPSVQDREEAAKQAAAPATSAAPVDKVAERNKEKNDQAVAAQRRQDNRSSGTNAGAAQAKSEDTAGADVQGGNEDGKAQSARNEARSTALGRRAAKDADETTTSSAGAGASDARTVAGKRFRQQNGVWVDTAYNSSRGAIRVRRGSEQYRALVADEPIVGRVANAFSGDVIVVVGSKAYRIY